MPPPAPGSRSSRRDITRGDRLARLLSVNVGVPRDVPWNGRMVHTSVWKAPAAGRRMVRRLDVEVCIGDRYRVGGALLEVTQPRVTCYRLGIRMDEPRMAALLVAHGRPGFYLRVIEEGEVGAGDEIEKAAEGPERMTVARTSALLYMPGHSRDD